VQLDVILGVCNLEQEFTQWMLLIQFTLTAAAAHHNYNYNIQFQYYTHSLKRLSIVTLTLVTANTWSTQHVVHLKKSKNARMICDSY